jgi:hypothetical protein
MRLKREKLEEMEEEEEDKDEEEDEEEVEEEIGEDKEEIPDEEVEQKILNKVLLESADPLPIRGGEPWQGDPVDSILSPDQKKSAFKKVNDEKINEGINSSTSNQKKKTCKKSKTKEGSKLKSEDLEELNSTTFKFNNNYKDASIFNSICGNDLKKEVAKNVKSSMNSDTVDIFITGPFCNEKNGRSYWIAVYGDYGSAWTLKSQFIKGYIRTLLTKVKKSDINMAHSNSYYDINIRKYEFGKEIVWRRKDQGKTTKRLSFVYTCNTSNKKTGNQGLIEAIKLLFMSMKKRDINPIGPLVIDYIKEHASSLYEYLLKKKSNEELVAKDITDDIDKHFRAGFVLHWDDHLNHWMVDYDIICILKCYVGYSSWTDVPTKQRELCYKNYNQNMTLPEWDIEQERY